MAPIPVKEISNTATVDAVDDNNKLNEHNANRKSTRKRSYLLTKWMIFLAILNQNRVINMPNNKLVLNEISANNNKCDRLNYEVPFMVDHYKANVMNC
jgi:hypothetical protein